MITFFFLLFHAASSLFVVGYQQSRWDRLHHHGLSKESSIYGASPTEAAARNLTLAATQPKQQPQQQRQHPTQLRLRPSHLIFPGGGIFFYWQAGVITYLRENGYDLSSAYLTGASAGALTATLTACDVDFYQATDLALSLAARSGVWDRPGGLQGIWGPLIYEWLDTLLPESAVAQVSGRLSLLITPIPSLGKEHIGDFLTRTELIECNMVSVHLPWFLDGRFTTKFRSRWYIDGSFRAKTDDYLRGCRASSQHTILLGYAQDPKYQNRGLFDIVEALSPDGIWGLLADGKRYAQVLEEQGAFEPIDRS